MVYHEFDESLSRYLLSKGDVLIAMTGNHPQALTQVVGDVSRYKLDVQALLNQRVGKLVVKKDADLDFIYYLFKDEEVQNTLANNSTGSANQANISKGDILGLQLTIPELPEQKAIAEVLSSLDDKIDLLNRQNKTLEQMAETFFRQWFVEEESELKPLSECIKTTSGGTPSRKRMDYYENGIHPWIKSKELIGGYILETEEKINDEALKNSSAKLLPKNSVLIAMYGATVGQFAIIGQEATCNQAICACIPNEDYPYTFVYHTIKSNVDELKSRAIGSAQQNISQVLIKSLDIAVNDNIGKFHLKVDPMMKKIKANYNQIRTLEKLRDTLLPKLMSGEIRLNYDSDDFDDSCDSKTHKNQVNPINQSSDK